MAYKKPTESELEILQILWSEGASTVRFVHEQLSKKRKTGYTTTLKTMQIMAEKQLVMRDVSSRTHIYSANITESDTQKKVVSNIVDKVFRGSAMKLVMQALGNKKTSSKELQEIRNYLDELENEQDNK